MHVERIQNALSQINSRGDFTELEPPQILILTRRLLEETASQPQFPIVNLYCNWLAHTQISKSKIVYDILLQLTKEFVRCNQDGTCTIAEPNRGVSKALSIADLQTQLATLYRTHNIDTRLLLPAYFRRFMGAILDQISRTPLLFPSPPHKGKARTMYSALMQAAGGDPHMMIVSLSVTNDLTEDALSFFGVRKGTYAWELRTGGDNIFTGLLCSSLKVNP
jgi:hypothetical protein